MQLLNQGSAPALLLAVPSLQLLVKGPVEKRTGRFVHQAGLLTERIQEALRVSSKR